MSEPRALREEQDFPSDLWEFSLFVVAGAGSAHAVHQELRRICEAHLPDRHRITVIDLTADAAQADAHDIVAVPTVVRTNPPPIRRVIGDLSLTDRVLEGLGIPSGEPT